MVRLKVGQHFRYVAKSISFQFHYGTIKSFDSFPRAHFEFNFNSTMVRLKVVASHIVRMMPPISIPLWYD